MRARCGLRPPSAFPRRGFLPRFQRHGSEWSIGDLARDRIGRNDADDRFMLALARLAFDLALPTEEAGSTPLPAPDRDEHWVRRLFERAVAGFYAVELTPSAWRVHSGQKLHWQVTAASDGINAILPTMRTDIILDAPGGRRIVIDTKFAAIVSKGWLSRREPEARISVPDVCLSAFPGTAGRYDFPLEQCGWYPPSSRDRKGLR